MTMMLTCLLFLCRSRTTSSSLLLRGSSSSSFGDSLGSRSSSSSSSIGSCGDDCCSSSSTSTGGCVELLSPKLLTLLRSKLSQLRPRGAAAGGAGDGDALMLTANHYVYDHHHGPHDVTLGCTGDAESADADNGGDVSAISDTSCSSSSVGGEVNGPAVTTVAEATAGAAAAADEVSAGKTKLPEPEDSGEFSSVMVLLLLTPAPSALAEAKKLGTCPPNRPNTAGDAPAEVLVITLLLEDDDEGVGEMTALVLT